MTFDFPGYDLKFIQKRRCKDASSHLFTNVYKFYSPVTRYFYILLAEFHEEEVYIVKFYAKPHRKSENKYRIVTNKGDLGNILITCLKSIPVLLTECPTASLGIIGSPSIDKKSRRMEGYDNNQRFIVYSGIAAQKIGGLTFTHLKYEKISGYLLINNCHEDINSKAEAIKDMFKRTYNNIPY